MVPLTLTRKRKERKRNNNRFIAHNFCQDLVAQVIESAVGHFICCHPRGAKNDGAGGANGSLGKLPVHYGTLPLLYIAKVTTC